MEFIAILILYMLLNSDLEDIKRMLKDKDEEKTDEKN